MIQGQLYAVSALLTQSNMPFVKSGVDFMADRFYFGCHFYINLSMPKI